MLQSSIGEVSGTALIRTKNGVPRVKDMRLLPSSMRAMIEGEITAGKYTYGDIESAQQELERNAK